MPWCKSKAIFGALAIAAALAIPIPLCAQQRPVSLTVTVEDNSGAAIQGASVKEASGQLLGRTDSSGRLTIECRVPCRLRIDAEGFVGQFVELSANATIRLQPAGGNEQVTVTAYRTPLASLDSPVATRLLNETALSTTAAITLDSKVRQLPGVEMFRRASSLVANPSSQGISMRGLGSTAASRTLLTEDDVPLNDPFAGWIHWQEQPELGVKSIEVVRGGASDLYGSSAIGGVLNVIPMRPTFDQAELKSSYGGEGTYDESLLVQGKRGPWGLLATGGVLGTDGFIQEAPQSAGPR